jgi:hypothetical protein
MTGDPDKVIVTTGGPRGLVALATRLHHCDFVEIHAEGSSGLVAARNVRQRLASALDDTPNHRHRGTLLERVPENKP